MELLFPKTISSISYNQYEILNDIISLHIPEGIECDVTYNVGAFYKNLNKPKFKFDISPLSEDVIQADARNLPLKNGSVKSLMFDPPFIASWNINSDDYVMKKTYSSVKGISNLLKMYDDSLEEAYRVLKNRGSLVVKCQDTVYGGKQYFNSIHVYNKAIELGFKPKDQFILLAKSRFIGPGKQKHSRKFHSYFWVFKKSLINNSQ